MIKSLHIRNLATIEEIELEFQPGFTILTGETGAGKSIIIDGLKLLLGERATPDLIRTGKKEALVEAVFKIKPWSRESTLNSYLVDGEIFLQRSITIEGTGRAYINGILVPVRRLKEIADELVDIYGQNDHVFLLQLENHLNYLDNYIEAIPLRQEVSSLYRYLIKLIEEKEAIQEKQKERERKLDFLAYQIEEIKRANLRPGEWDELVAERYLLKNAEKIARLCEKALEIAYNNENSLLALIKRLTTHLDELSQFEPSFKEIISHLEPLNIMIQETVHNLIRLAEKQEASPDKLEKIEERLSQIERLKRKYGGEIEDILDYLKKIEEERKELLNTEERLFELNKEIELTFKEYQNKANLLSDKRKKGAKDLEKQLKNEISQLGLKQAEFHIKISSHPLSLEQIDQIKETGWDEVEFLISPNPGEELRPLRRIASGGELSRIMLALKTIGKETSLGKTLIFDEIDSGIGGQTADLIAQKLRTLSQRHQVVCITHLPQIASFANHHFRIVKRVVGERTFTEVEKLDFEERVKEVARLLSGRRITQASLQNAREMLRHNLRRDIAD
ncbi:MAG: DNA repair protein RecN [Candidatus Aminicenantes bacterium]|nr:DNA repair protein RecN [Candidatus Aminicenantes bacterium]